MQKMIPQDQSLAGQVVAHSPMHVVRSLTASNNEARSSVVYFRPSGVQCPGLDRENVFIIDSMLEVHQALALTMKNTEFFISMIPEYYLHARPEIATTIPETQPIPDFFGALEPLRTAAIRHSPFFDQLEVELHIDTGREFCGQPTSPQITLRTLGRIDSPKTTKVLSIEVLSHESLAVAARADALRAVMNWFAGAAGGLVAITWRTGR